MPSAVEAVATLERALAQFAPIQTWYPPDQPISQAEAIWFEIPAELRPAEQKLVVRPLGDGHIQVEYHYVGKKGSPFEMLLVGGEDQPGCAEAAARFVADLISERLVLVYKKSVLTGGRRFLSPEELNSGAKRSFNWATSWRGTYDWEQ